jgi:hypothetical protein
MTDVTGWAVIVMQALGTTPVLDVAELRFGVGAFPVFGAALANLHGGRTVEPAVNALVTGEARLLTAAAAARLCRRGSAEPVEAATQTTEAV